MNDEIRYLERVWTYDFIVSLIRGGAVERRQAAYDNGQPEDLEELLDVIQFEADLAMVPDLHERAAITLSMSGWPDWDIGYVFEHSRRSGHSLIAGGARAIAKINERRAEMRKSDV